MSSKPVLGYWDIRGYTQQIRLLLKYLKVDYEDKLYGFGSGPEPTTEAWYNEKYSHGFDFPNLPYWKDGSFQVTESKAIFKYVAQTRGPQLVPAIAQEEAVSDMIDGLAQDLQQEMWKVAYNHPLKTEKTLEEAVAPKFQELNKFLETRDFILGNKLTYNDFFVYEVLHQFSVFISGFLKPYPALEEYVQRFESLPQIADMVKATANYVCYSPYATIKF